MTIEARRLALGLPVVLAGWIAILALTMHLAGAPSALVLLPPADFLARLPPGIAVQSAGPVSVTVRGAGNITPALYRAGAVLVLPAGLSGCLAETRLPLGL